MVVRLCGDDGSVLYGSDGRTLEFVGGNAFRLACHAVRGRRRHAVTGDGESPYGGDIRVVSGEYKWRLETDGSVIPCE